MWPALRGEVDLEQYPSDTAYRDGTYLVWIKVGSARHLDIAEEVGVTNGWPWWPVQYLLAGSSCRGFASGKVGIKCAILNSSKVEHVSRHVVIIECRTIDSDLYFDLCMRCDRGNSHEERLIARGSFV